MSDEIKDVIIKTVHLIRCNKVNISMSNKDIIEEFKKYHRYE